MADKPSCYKCIHYFITHNPSMPYGCRALGFKTAHNPAQVVFNSSGIHCQLFSPKDRSKNKIISG